MIPSFPPILVILLLVLTLLGGIIGYCIALLAVKNSARKAIDSAHAALLRERQMADSVLQKARASVSKARRAEGSPTDRAALEREKALLEKSQGQAREIQRLKEKMVSMLEDQQRLQRHLDSYKAEKQSGRDTMLDEFEDSLDAVDLPVLSRRIAAAADQSVREVDGQASDEPAMTSSEQSSMQFADFSTQASTEETSQQPIDITTQASVEETSQQPIDISTHASTEETSQQPIDITTQASVEETLQQPADPLTQAATEETALQSVDISTPVSTEQTTQQSADLLSAQVFDDISRPVADEPSIRSDAELSTSEADKPTLKVTSDADTPSDAGRRKSGLEDPITAELDIPELEESELPDAADDLEFDFLSQEKAGNKPVG